MFLHIRGSVTTHVLICQDPNSSFRNVGFTIFRRRGRRKAGEGEGKEAEKGEGRGQGSRQAGEGEEKEAEEEAGTFYCMLSPKLFNLPIEVNVNTNIHTYVCTWYNEEVYVHVETLVQC